MRRERSSAIATPARGRKDTARDQGRNRGNAAQRLPRFESAPQELLQRHEVKDAHAKNNKAMEMRRRHSRLFPHWGDAKNLLRPIIYIIYINIPL